MELDLNRLLARLPSHPFSKAFNETVGDFLDGVFDRVNRAQGKDPVIKTSEERAAALSTSEVDPKKEPEQQPQQPMWQDRLNRVAGQDVSPRAAMGLEELSREEVGDWERMFGRKPPSEESRLYGKPYSAAQDPNWTSGFRAPPPERATSRDEAFQFYYQEEGGYTVDQGGRTFMGFSERFNPDIWRESDRLGLKHPTPEMVHEATLERYWKPIRGDELPRPVALVMLTFSANAGPQRAIRSLQKQIGLTGKEIDGLFGPKTKAALDGYEGDWRDLARDIGEDLASHHLTIAARDPATHGASLLGWMRRDTRLRQIVGSIPAGR